MNPADIVLTTRRLSPAEAEVCVHAAEPVSGRLVGPRCRYATTIEVAHYVRLAAGGGNRVIIPEPSFWEPETPFYYEAILETGSPSRLVNVRHGLRSLSWDREGLRVNGKPIALKSASCDRLDDDAAAGLRKAGVNTLVCTVTPEQAAIWELADKVGFFVIGRLEPDREAEALAARLSTHPSSLGWIVAEVPHEARLHRGAAGEPFLGVRMDGHGAPPWARFVIDADGKIVWAAM